MNKKISVLMAFVFLLLSALLVTATPSATFSIPSANQKVDRETGINITFTVSTETSPIMNCTFPDTVSGTVTVSNTSANQTTWYRWWGNSSNPISNSLAGCKNTVSTTCYQANGTSATGTSSEFCISSFEASDIPTVAIDTLGSFGANTKTWMTLIALAVIALIIVMAWRFKT